MSPYLPKAKTHSTTPLIIATANEHHSLMMHLIVECGVDPVLNDDTHEKPDDNSPEEEVDVYENSGQNTLFWALTAGEGDDHAGLLAALSLSGRVDLGKRDACGSLPLHYAAVARNPVIAGELRAVESCYGTRVDVAAVDGAGETAAEIAGRMGVDVGAFV